MAPLDLELSVEDIFNVLIPKCKTNAQFMITAYFDGVNDKSLTPIEDPQLKTQFNGALVFNRYKGQDVTSIKISANEKFCE